MGERGRGLETIVCAHWCVSRCVLLGTQKHCSEVKSVFVQVCSQKHREPSALLRPGSTGVPPSDPVDMSGEDQRGG